MCIEAWLDGCVERLLGIFVVKVPIFLVRWSYFLCDGSWRNSLPLFCRMFTLYSIECFSLLLSVVSLFFYQLFLSFVRCFSFLSIGYFSFLVVEGCVCFLFTAHFWSRAHILMRAPYRTFSCYLFLTLICTFCTLNPWFYCWGVGLFIVSGRWREKYPFPSHLIRWITTICCIPVKGEGEKRKTAEARVCACEGEWEDCSSWVSK